MDRRIKLVYVIIGGAIIVFAAVYTMLLNFQPVSSPYRILTKADLSISRMLDCTANCTDPVNRQIIAKYPELERAMNLADERYTKVSNVCDTNECLELRWSDYDRSNSYGVYFSLSKDRATQIDNDLRQNGARIIGQAIDLPGHLLGFNVGNATYNLSVFYS